MKRRKIAATTEEIGVMAWVAAGVLCAFGQFLIVIIVIIAIISVIREFIKMYSIG